MLVVYHANQLLVYDHRCTDSLKTGCLRHNYNGSRVIKKLYVTYGVDFFDFAAIIAATTWSACTADQKVNALCFQQV